MPADPVVALLPVTQDDVAAANALDDALGFLTDLERPIVEQAFARHRLAHRTPAPAGDVREDRICLPPEAYDIQLMLKGGMPGCPCCGRTAMTFTRFFPHSSIYQAYVHCAHCDLQVFKNSRDHDDARRLAAEAWTTRPPTPDSSAVSGSAEGLREALKPFAALASYMAGRHGTVIGWDHDRVTYDDFRNAAAALAALTEGQQS